MRPVIKLGSLTRKRKMSFTERRAETGIRGLLFIVAIVAVVAIFAILFFLLREAYPIFESHGVWNFISGKIWKPEGEIYGFPAQYGTLSLILATVLVSIGAMVIAVPLGIGCAIFISEIASPRLRAIIKPAIELLAGIPSVVYGFFGLIVLVTWLQVNFSVPSGEGWLAGSIILAIMALPTIASVAEDAINAVPREFKEGSYAVGATKWQTIKNVTIPSAMSGITAAIILGIGRAIGETMAVMMVIGNSPLMPSLSGPFQPIKTLTSTIILEMGEAPVNSMWQNSLYGVAVLLLLIVLLVNTSSTIILGRIRKSQMALSSRKHYLSHKSIKKIKRVFYLCGGVLVFVSIAYAGNTLAAIIFLACIAMWYVLRYTLQHKGILQVVSPKTSQRIVFGMIISAVVITIILLGIILGYVVTNGVEALSWEFITGSPRNLGREGGIFPAIYGTMLLVGGSIFIALPIGVLTAIYLNEYTREGKVKKIIRAGADLLNGTPSIVFGLFGLTFLVLYLGWGKCLLAGQVTLSLMILPTIIRTTEEALKSVPDSLREGSYALGATKWQTIRRVVLQPSVPGIMTGAILSIGRAAGETAPILFTAAVAFQRNLPLSVFKPAMALPVHLYGLSTEIHGADAKINAAGTALVLVILVLCFYLTAIVIRNRYSKKMRW